jgi:hypothetical protein
MDRGKPKLHDYALKRVMTHHAAVVETEMVKGFRPEPYVDKVPTTTPPKRVTIPTGIAAVGVETLSFHPE